MDITIFMKGIPCRTLKGKCRDLLLVIQKFIIYEGRFGFMFFYHIRLMMHFLEENEINLPFFFINSLRKMSGNVQKRIQLIENTMYHHNLIKKLIEFHLERLGDNWDSFLVKNHFNEEDQESPNNNKEKQEGRGHV